MRVTKGRTFKRGTRFWVDYQIDGERFRQPLTDPAGNPITNATAARTAADIILRPYTAKAEAERRRLAADALRAAREVAEAAERAAQRTPLATLWDLHPYIANTRGTQERQLSEKSVRDFKSLWTHFTGWAEARGIRHAEDVTRAHVEAFRRDLDQSGLSGDRQNKVFLTCRVMFRAAKIEANPFDGFRKLAHTANGRRELTEVELRAVCGSATGELRVLLAIGLYTGLRLGDACQLDWAEVARDLSRIIREPSKTRYRGVELVIPCHPVLSAILAETPPERRSGPVLHELCASYITSSSKVVRRIGRHFETCGVRLHKAGTGEGTARRAVVEVGFHSLRHSFVSLAARQGVPLHVIQALCGHSTPAVQRLYLHNTPNDTARAVNALPDITVEAQALPAPEDPARAALVAKFTTMARSASMDALRAAVAALEGGAR